MNLNLTLQQDALISHCLSRSGHFVGQARAGTGKTATLKIAGDKFSSKFPDLEILGMAFNKSISVALGEALPTALVKTYNAFGHGAWIKRSGKSNIKLNGNKTRDIIREINGEGFEDLPRAVNLCKAWGIVPSGTLAEPKGLYPDEPGTYKTLFENYDIDVEDCPDPIGLVREALSRSILRGWRGEIDFDDQLYLSTIYRAKFPKGDLVLVDEAQDLNPVQRTMTQLMLKPDARVFALGDDRQAIYGFRGADRESLPNLIELFDAKVFPLTVSFRCPREIVLWAQQFVKDIEPWEGATEGEVKTEAKPSVEKLQQAHLKGPASVLCRNNAPLISLCLKFFRENIGATILGKDVAAGLVGLIRKQKARSIQELNSKIWDHIEGQIAYLNSRGRDGQASVLSDKRDCLEILIGNQMPNGTIEGIYASIQDMFSDKEKGTITLSTIHKSKGLEWPEVFILDPTLMPSKWAKTPSAKTQEDNLHYVAITRSQRTLTYIYSEDF